VQTVRRHILLAACVAVTACLGASAAIAQESGGNGGISPSDPAYKPASRATIVDGKAVPPPGAPPEVVAAINAANAIVTKPYRYGGGHKSFDDSGYDCSGSISYALRGANLLTSPLDSSGFMRWGKRGRGRWITVYTNPGHAYVMIAGRRLDTGGRSRTAARSAGVAPGSGPRWGGRRSTRGYVARHPAGL